MLGEDVSRLIGDIYEHAHDASSWDRTMNAVAARLDARWLMVAVIDRAGRRPSGAIYYGATQDSSFADGVREYYADELYRIDPVNHFAAETRCGEFDSRAIASSDEYLAHPYTAWNQHRLGSAFWRFIHSPDDSVKLGMSIHHDKDQGPLSPANAALFRLLFSHMDRATRLATRPPLIEGSEPVMILDRRGAVVGTNDPARRLLAARDGVELVDGCVQARDRRSRDTLNRAILAALSVSTTGGSGGSAAIERPGRPALLATVSPMPETAAPFAVFRSAVIVRLIDRTTSPEPRDTGWSTLFGLTPAETRLATTLLASDGNLRHIAGQLGIAYATARVQLANVFDKVGVNSQIQLVRLPTRLSGS